MSSNTSQLINRALGHHQAGRLQQAEIIYHSIIKKQPQHTDASHLLGVLSHQVGKNEIAVELIEKAIKINPDVADFYNNCGEAYRALNNTGLAITHFQQALAIEPDYAQAHYSQGAALQELSRVEEAISHYEQALVINSDYAEVHSNLLLALNYLPETSQEKIYAESKTWNRRHAQPLLPETSTFRNNRDAERKLKIGYISPDFRSHSVAYFFEPLLKQHDGAKVETYCYSNVKKPDAVTGRLKESSDHWCSIVGQSDLDVADRIKHDEIDILVDLAGHTANNRLLVLARRPAPVQVTWLGYPNTTGLESIDYRFTDEIADPVGLSDKLHSEELIRLKSGFLAFQDSDTASSVLPRSERGYITFGSFNNLTKVMPEVVSLWIEILRTVPDAHLLLKSKSLVDGEVRDRYLSMFRKGQISDERIELHGYVQGLQERMQLYGEVDIGLDPFPYNGTTTTCEALWMGVPVVTLTGDRHAGRVGASLLKQVGLDELIALDPQSYIDIAVGLAQDSDKLTSLRCSLRETMTRSKLCNTADFAGEVEDAYAVMWEQYLLKSQA